MAILADQKAVGTWAAGSRSLSLTLRESFGVWQSGQGLRLAMLPSGWEVAGQLRLLKDQVSVRRRTVQVQTLFFYTNESQTKLPALALGRSRFNSRHNRQPSDRQVRPQRPPAASDRNGGRVHRFNSLRLLHRASHSNSLLIITHSLLATKLSACLCPLG